MKRRKYYATLEFGTMEDISKRIKHLMENEDLTAGAFADKIGVQQSTVSHTLTGRNNPSLDFIMKVHQAFNYINLDWLLYGSGEMITQQEKSPTPPNANLFNGNAQNVSHPAIFLENCKDMALENLEKVAEKPKQQEVRYIEKPPKRITEIRVFYDDNTYEIFKME